jgi:hypothetical protein
MRLGRSYSDYFLRRPVVVFAPAPPTQQQQTITTLYRVPVGGRRDYPRRFPLQGWDGTLQLHSGGATEFDQNSPGATSPLLGVRPPKLVARVPALRVQTIEVELAVFARRLTEQRRFPLQGWEGWLTRVSSLSDGGTQTMPLRQPLLGVRPPTVVSPLPTQRQQTIVTKLVAVRDRPRHTLGTSLAAPTVLSKGVFTGPTVTTVRTRPRPTVRFLTPPTTLQVFAGPTVTTTRARPRPTTKFLLPPTVIRVPSVEQREQTVAVTLVRARPRHTLGTRLAAPTVVRVPSVEQREQTISVALVRTRPRPTTRFLLAPTVLQVFAGATVTVTRTRPRPTTRRLAPPTVVAAATFFGPAVTVVRTRPRPTTRFLAKPTVVRVPSVEQREQTLGVTTVRTRPRHTLGTKLNPPTVLQVFSGPSVTVTRTRPRPTTRRLAPPTVVASATFFGPSVFIVRTRPRPTTRRLAPPTVLIVPSVEQQRRTLTARLVQTRPRHTLGTRLTPPTVIRVPSVELREQTVTVTIVRARPRHTVGTRLQPPTVLQVFAGPVEAEIAIRIPLEDRRRTPHSRLQPPTVVRVPAVEQREQTVQTHLARIRPPKTQGTRLAPPTVIRVPSVEQAEDTIRVTVVRTRPRPTVRLLAPPTVLQVFAGPEVFVVRTRPRPTTRRLAPPTVVAAGATQQQQTITVWLAGRTRSEAGRRGPHSVLRPPTVTIVNPPVKTAITSWLVEPGNRRDLPRRFPLQGFRQRTVRETNAAVGIGYQQRDPFLGPRPPQIIDPLPTQRVQTITVWLVEPGQRRTWPRRFPLQGWRQRPVRETGAAATSNLQGFDPLLGPRPPQIVLPLPTQQMQTITVLLALRRQIEDVRRRPHYALRPPTKINPAPARVATTLVALRTRLETQRLRPTFRLSRPQFYPATSTIAVTLAGRTRVEAQRRAPHYRLTPPVVIRIPAVEQQLRTISITLVRIRPPHTIGTRLAPPTVVRVPSVAQLEQTIRVTLAGRTRAELGRRQPHYRVSPPAVVTFTKGLLKTLLAGGDRLTLVRRGPHSQIGPPIIVAPPPTQGQQTIGITLVAVSTATGMVRRRPHFFLAPPVVIRPLTGFEFRVDDIPTAWWTARRITIGWDETEPDAGVTVGKPSAEWETDLPDSDTKAGKPK